MTKKYQNNPLTRQEIDSGIYEKYFKKKIIAGVTYLGIFAASIFGANHELNHLRDKYPIIEEYRTNISLSEEARRKEFDYINYFYDENIDGMTLEERHKEYHKTLEELVAHKKDADARCANLRNDPVISKYNRIELIELSLAVLFSIGFGTYCLKKDKERNNELDNIDCIYDIGRRDGELHNQLKVRQERNVETESYIE